MRGGAQKSAKRRKNKRWLKAPDTRVGVGATDRSREELDKLGWHADELAAVSRKVDWDAQRANAIGKEVWRRLPHSIFF